MNFLKNKKIIWEITTIFVVLIFLAIPIVLKADTVIDALNGATTGGSILVNVALTGTLKIVNALLVIFLGVIGAILVLMGKLLGVVLSLTLNPQFYTDGIVGTGFKIVLQVADMLFLIIMMVIGIATIVQYESYNLKKLLPTIILVALLINFSLPITQFIIGFADDLAVFFFNHAFQGNLSKIGDLLIQQVGLPTFVIDADTSKAGGGFCSGALSWIPTVYIGCKVVNIARVATGNAILQQLALTNTLVLAILIFLITLIYLIVGVVLFLIRTVMLWSLIILAPLAWISGVLPHTSHYLSGWWKKFFTWAFFPFLFALFLYISLSIVTNQTFKSLTTDFIGQIDLTSLGAAFNSFAALSLGPILGAMTIFILFFGGIFISLSLAGDAGAAVVNGTKTAKNWAVGAASRRYGAPILSKVGEGLSKTGVVGQVTGLKALGGMAMLKAGGLRGEQRSAYEKKYANMSNLSPEQQKILVQNTLRSPLATGVEKAAALSKLRESNPGEFAATVEKDPAAKGYVQQHGTEKDKMEAIKATGDITFKLTQDEAKDPAKVEAILRKAFSNLTPEEAKKTKFDEMLKNKTPETSRIISETVLSQLNGDALVYMAQANPNSLKALADSSAKGLTPTRNAEKDRKARNTHFKNRLRADTLRYASSPAVQHQLGTTFETPQEKERLERRKDILARKKLLEQEIRRKNEGVEAIKKQEEIAMKQAEKIAEAIRSASNNPPSQPPSNTPEFYG